MEEISIKAPAKINLYLRVLGKRADSYHEIETLMQAIDLYDVITLEKADTIKFNCSDPSLPQYENNLAVRAAKAFQEKFPFPGVSINLEKHIPSGAGLGGGSSDAAFVLRGLCRLYGLNPAYEELSEIAASLGSDVPFFLSSGQAVATGRGEVLHPVSLPLDYSIAVISPAISLSTAEAYGALKIVLTKNKVKPIISSGIDHNSFMRLAINFRNDLEEVALTKFPNLLAIKRSLLGSGAFYSSMTGSGSSFFGLFEPGTEKKQELECLSERGMKIFWCKPILLEPFG